MRSDDLDNGSQSSAKKSGRPVYVLLGSAGVLVLLAALIGTGLALRSNPSISASASMSAGVSMSAGASDFYGCTDNADMCGPDYEVPGTMVDPHSGQSAFIVAVHDGLTRARAEQIAQEFASRHGSSPTVVYIVPWSARWETAAFGVIPNPLESSNLQEVADPMYAGWILTYISVPSILPVERWGPGANGLASRLPSWRPTEG